jgi:solute carrier family 13 (sodium-dependent dicarboxylate transporter), member 2/3/5
VGRVTEGSTRRRLGLVLGPASFLVLLLVPRPETMSEEAWLTSACGILMAILWITEAIPIPATALLPLALFPILGILPISDAAGPYANPVIFLFLGGFLIAAALERCGLHRRMALAILRVVGSRPRNIVGGFMIATAFLSMWVSNTATVVMMLPTALSVLAVTEAEAEGGRSDAFAIALLLGLAYAANIGGLATLIGTPPNALLAGFMLETYGVTIGFVQWMAFGVPLVAVALPLAWALLVYVLHPLGSVRFGRRGSEVIASESRSLGPMTREEWVVGGITTMVALSWVFRPLLAGLIPGLSDAGIAISGAILLFAVPVRWKPLQTSIGWHDTQRLPWAVLILFGGGLSLASAIESTGVAAWIGGSMAAIRDVPLLVMVVLVTAVVVFLTELTSNTATAAAFLPVVASLALGLGSDPMLLALPTALAASCAFMMPVATPPNAIVYGSGRLTIPQMARAGLWLNFAMIALVDLLVLKWGLRVLG